MNSDDTYILFECFAGAAASWHIYLHRGVFTTPRTDGPRATKTTDCMFRPFRFIKARASKCRAYDFVFLKETKNYIKDIEHICYRCLESGASTVLSVPLSQHAFRRPSHRILLVSLQDNEAPYHLRLVSSSLGSQIKGGHEPASCRPFALTFARMGNKCEGYFSYTPIILL